MWLKAIFVPTDIWKVTMKIQAEELYIVHIIFWYCCQILTSLEYANKLLSSNKHIFFPIYYILTDRQTHMAKPKEEDV
jgi:hypothetical protein